MSDRLCDYVNVIELSDSRWLSGDLLIWVIVLCDYVNVIELSDLVT